jgi:CBS domain containing-hemolysin-like protein
MYEKDIPMVAVFDEHGGICGAFSFVYGVGNFVHSYFKQKEMALGQKKCFMHRQEDGNFLIDGKCPLEEIEKLLKCPVVPDSLGDGKTLGGWLSSQEGRIPLKGQVVRPHEGWCFIIQEADPTSIEKALLIRWPTKEKTY